jgi:hypothetical protein
MLFDFCNAEKAKTACGYPNGNNTIVTSLNNSVDITIDQTALGYGNICAYRIHTTCGYPKFNIVGKNLYAKLAFNKGHWDYDDDDDDDDDDDHDDWDDDDIKHNSTWSDDMDLDFDDDYDWTMPKEFKNDYFNETLKR